MVSMSIGLGFNRFRMTNYFDFYSIKPSFLLEEAALKRIFYKKSKEYHPDFYTLESDEKQAEILSLSTLNNKAYKTLGDFHRRMHHILDLHGLIEEEGKANLPQMFLMEMMDVNEEIMELQMDPNPTQQEEILKDIQSIDDQLISSIIPMTDAYDFDDPNMDQLSLIKEYYFKHKYLLRLRENLNKFAPS